MPLQVWHRDDQRVLPRVHGPEVALHESAEALAPEPPVRDGGVEPGTAQHLPVRRHVVPRTVHLPEACVFLVRDLHGRVDDRVRVPALVYRALVPVPLVLMAVDPVALAL
ncbi:hypothetical protein DGo_PE0005 (plasmid) [Deinococcus gobiensis I-0]|uniref:Uncharacterized protein n=1 Tax=Deinococcus gobiensis (strain DSM 21396 / JCM 16679 / CGMCC 1.7299 / I-0) TaxID=745776 RepID=H8H3Q2_DEIGI|nr:hypothetical protein DGo_PE0005 [Deinococcus gobiensis I-0]